MAGISLCSDPKDCRISSYCRRFTAKPNDLYQSYISPERNDGLCSSFKANQKLNSLKVAFKRWAAAAPVQNSTTQLKAAQYFRTIANFFTPQEDREIGVALSHARIGEGREEFDRLMKATMERLGFEDDK